MEINIKVIPKSSNVSIQKMSNGTIKIKVHSPAQNNKANLEVINLISKRLNIPHNHIVIKRGVKSPQKTLEIYGIDNISDLFDQESFY